MRALVIGLLLTASLLSGCFADDGADDDGDVSTEPTTGGTNNTTLEPEVFPHTGAVTASTNVVGFSDGGLSFAVGDGATVLFAELQWDDPVADLDLSLASPSSERVGDSPSFDHSAEGGTPGAPDSPHSLTIETPEAGEWIAGAMANGAAANVEYTLVVSVFYVETAVPEGYTALP